MAPPTLAMAVEANAFARQTFPRGSTNLISTRPDLATAEDALAAAQIKMAKSGGLFGVDESDPEALAKAIKAIDGTKAAGNCGELARAAFVDLYKKDASPIGIVAQYNSDGTDHTFVVAGKAWSTNEAVDTPLQMDLRQWGDALIVDSWVNLVCKATEYPAKFAARIKAYEVLMDKAEYAKYKAFFKDLTGATGATKSVIICRHPAA